MPGLLRMATRTAVVAGTATAVSGNVARRQQGRWAAQEQQQQAAQAPVAPAPAAPAESTEDPTITKIKELAALHAQGILTDEEFASAKAKALGA